MGRYKYPFGRPYGHRYYGYNSRIKERKYQVIFEYGEIINDIPTSDLRGMEQDIKSKYHVYDTAGRLVSPLNPDGTSYYDFDEEKAVKIFLKKEGERKRSWVH